jgi:hypothetical protein
MFNVVASMVFLFISSLTGHCYTPISLAKTIKLGNLGSCGLERRLVRWDSRGNQEYFGVLFVPCTNNTPVVTYDHGNFERIRRFSRVPLMKLG